jgi:Uncharacterized protein related to plant photosystem II stability/assembly factor
MIKKYLLSIVLACSLAFTMQGQTIEYSNYSVDCGGSVQIKSSLNWTNLTSGTTLALKRIVFVDKNTGFAIGDSGLILKTTDAGTTWTKKSPLTYDASCLKSIYFLDKNTGYTIGSEDIRKTTDGGETWKHVSGLAGNVIWMTSANTGFVGTYDGLYNIKDNGDTLNVDKISDSPNINSIYFSSSMNGYAVGDYGLFFKTTNGGATWTWTTCDVSNNLKSVYFTDANNGYIVGELGIFLKTTNGGTSWTSKTLSGGIYNGNDIYFTSPDTGYIVASKGIRYKTTDRGENWTYKRIGAKTLPNMQSITYTDSNTGYIVADGGGIYKYDGNGTYSWSPSTGLSDTTAANPIAHPVQSLTYKLTFKSNNNITSTYSFPVTVNQISVNAGSDQSIHCGEIAQLGVTTNYTGSGTLKYKWTPSTGLSNDSVANPSASPTTTTTYTVTISTPGGCTSSDQINITVQPLTVNAGSDQSIHCGENAQLNVTTNYAGTQKLKYKWTPSTGLSNDTITNPVATTTSNQIYTVTVTTPNGCTYSNDIQVSLTPLSSPSLGIVTANSSNNNVVAWLRPTSTVVDSICVYRETNVTNVYKKIGSVAYSAPNQFVDSLSNTSVQSNKYRISLKDHCGFESTQSDPHKSMHLAINQGMNGSWNLIWEAYSGFTVSTYNIYRGTNAQNITLINSTSGSNTQYTDLTAPSGNVYYQIEVISPYSIFVDKLATAQSASLLKSATISTFPALYYSSRSNVATNNTAGIATTTSGELLSVYPNPAKDNIRISANSLNGDDAILNIYNTTGSLVKSDILGAPDQSYDISSLSNGIYILELKSGNLTYKKRLIVNK